MTEFARDYYTSLSNNYMYDLTSLPKLVETRKNTLDIVGHVLITNETFALMKVSGASSGLRSVR